MFSIIMPVWNRANTVTRAVESVLAQTLKDYELLIIDDGSEDGLEGVIRPYLAENIVYHRLPHSGLSAARNFGIKQAKGSFIAYLDSDNTWHPEFLERMYDALNGTTVQREAAYCRFNRYVKDQVSEDVCLSAVVGARFNFRTLLSRNYIDLNTFVHSKRCVKYTGLFDERLKRFDDWDFILRVTSRYEPIFVAEILVDYFYGIAENAISLTEDGKWSKKLIKKKNRRFIKPIRIVHDTITYSWENIPDEKFYNWVRLRNKELNTTDFTACGFPCVLQIEPTNVCNLSCPLCPTGRNELSREPRHMGLNEFKSIIDDMESYLLFLILWDWGEPFMNPEFPAMVRYASERDIKTVTSTNAQFLHNEAYVEEVLKSGLSTLIVAIDSVCEDNYQIYRKKGDLNKAISGLRNLVALKRQLDSKTLINMRMVIMKHNEHELKKMRKLAKEISVDRFTVKTVNPSCGLASSDQEIVPDNPKYRRFVYKRGTYERIRIDERCRRIWETSNIFSNGDVVPCCYDYNSEMKVGNIREKPLSKVWASPAYRELRKRIYYQKDSIPKCRECHKSFKYSKGGWFAESINFNDNIKTRFVNKFSRYISKLRATEYFES